MKAKDVITAMANRYDAVAIRDDGSWYGCWRDDIPANAIDTYYLLPEQTADAQRVINQSIAVGWQCGDEEVQ